MAKTTILKVVARAGRVVSDRHSLAAGARRFVGRGHFPSLTLTPDERVRMPSIVDQPGMIPARKLPFVEVHHHHDYVHALRHGDLVAFDEATAKACGVKFQPDLLKESEVVDEDSGCPRIAREGEPGDLEAHAAKEAADKAAEAVPVHEAAPEQAHDVAPSPTHGSES
jgi:hypothetical protein